MSNLQTYYHFKLDFQKVEQHTGGKWLIHGTKRRKDNHCDIEPVYMHHRWVVRDIRIHICWQYTCTRQS